MSNLLTSLQDAVEAAQETISYLVKEDRVYRSYSMDKFLQRRNNQDIMRKNSTLNYNIELQSFKNRI